MEVPDDAKLVQRCLAGDRRAFDGLVERYQTPVYNAALRVLGDREEARDVAQTSFLKAYEHLSSYDPQHRFFSWLYRIALNTAIDTRAQRRVSSGEEPVLLADTTPGPEALAAGESTLLAVSRALQGLPVEQRHVIVLRHHLQLSYEVIGEALQLPLPTVKSRLYEARQVLRVLLRDERGGVP